MANSRHQFSACPCRFLDARCGFLGLSREHPSKSVARRAGAHKSNVYRDATVVVAVFVDDGGVGYVRQRDTEVLEPVSEVANHHTTPMAKAVLFAAACSSCCVLLVLLLPSFLHHFSGHTVTIRCVSPAAADLESCLRCYQCRPS